MRSRAATWFEVKVKYDKMSEDGAIKSVKEMYVFDSLTFTEAETTAIDELAEFISGEYKVVSIMPTAYKEIFFAEDEKSDKWYKAKLMFITIDEKSGKEKRQAVYYLVQADNILNAVKNVNEVMETTMIDYVIASCVETQILEVYEHKVKQE